MKPTILIFSGILCIGCGTPKKSDTASVKPLMDKRIEAITLLGDTLFSVQPTNLGAIEKYEKAKSDFDADPQNIDNIIWYGRRTAYLGRYQDAIEVYTEGIKSHPDNARLYRHRGHRYISTRQYDNAILDFERAAELIIGTPNQIEEDGIPNAQNKPISSLHGNIYYHLALTYYLKNDLENAERVYQKRITTHQNDDNTVSAGHWHYMTLRRLGKKSDAEAIISNIGPELEVIENMHYHNICLFYKGELEEGDLTMTHKNGSINEVFLYGLGNWYLYEKNDKITARKHFNRLIKEGNKASFAYLAAEADLERGLVN